MNEIVNVTTATDIADQLMLYFLFTAHLCMMLNLSKWQKNRGDQFTFISASVMAAVVPVIAIHLLSFQSTLVKHEIGAAIAVLFCIVFTFMIPRFRKAPNT